MGQDALGNSSVRVFVSRSQGDRKVRLIGLEPRERGTDNPSGLYISNPQCPQVVGIVLLAPVACSQTMSPFVNVRGQCLPSLFLVFLLSYLRRRYFSPVMSGMALYDEIVVEVS